MASTPRNYALPNKYHDVVDDITEMRNTFAAIDSDVSELEVKVNETADAIEKASKQVLQSDVADPTLQNISAGRFLALDSDNFTCVDGSGNSGGITGQCTIKRSSDNFDQSWCDVLEASKNCQTVKENASEATGSDTIILSDNPESESEAMKPELVCVQAIDNPVAKNNESFILRDSIEQAVDGEQLATPHCNGVIKIGDGVQVVDGIISASSFSKATKDNYGLVQVETGIDIDENSVIGTQAIGTATTNTYGVVKLGSEFTTDSNGALALTTATEEKTIYSLGKPKLVENGNVNLEENNAWYRAFVAEGLQFKININFTPTNDFTFLLEIVSDGSHIISFVDELIGTAQTIPINRGTTRIYFTKVVGLPYFKSRISQLDAPEPICLTPSTQKQINSNFLMYTPQGGNWYPYNLLKDSYDGYSDIREVQFEFETLVCVDYIRYFSRSNSAAMGEFILKGSNDGKNWTTLLYENNEIIYGDIYTETKGCFRYYNLSIGYTSDDNKPGVVTLWGTQIDNNSSELKALTPLMSSNATAFATLTASKIQSNSATQLTDNNPESFMAVGYDDDGNRWVKYELANPAAVNLLELNFRAYDSQANWFTLEGSNDDSEWTLLIERQYQGNVLFNNNYRILYIPFENEISYKYYRLNCIATNDTAENWHICGFKLYRRDSGRSYFYGAIPNLESASQDGYEITASASESAWHVFDGEASSYWSAGTNIPAWIQVQLPAATAFIAFRITARNEKLAFFFGTLHFRRYYP